jgi:hypothetical protein
MGSFHAGREVLFLAFFPDTLLFLSPIAAFGYRSIEGALKRIFEVASACLLDSDVTPL